MRWSKSGDWKTTLAGTRFQLYQLPKSRQEPQNPHPPECKRDGASELLQGLSEVKESTWGMRAPHGRGVFVGMLIPWGMLRGRVLGAFGRPWL